MKQEEKKLLLKDLYARIPYAVKILHQGWNYETDDELSTLERVTGVDERFIYTKVINDNGEEYTSGRHAISLYDDKPYLFSLSSMTEEQYKKYWELEHSGDMEHLSIPLLDWLNKNHFDYRGLIEKGLAIDATGKNVY